MAENREITGKNQEIRDSTGRFLPGVSGNPAGRPEGSKSFTTKVRLALEKIADGKDYTYEEAFIKSILKKAILDQDPTIIRLIWNYLDGMPRQTSDMNLNIPQNIIDLIKDAKQRGSDELPGENKE